MVAEAASDFRAWLARETAYRSIEESNHRGAQPGDDLAAATHRVPNSLASAAGGSAPTKPR